MPASKRIVQVCFFIFAFIGLVGGTLQMFLGQPDTTPRLDNVHRFMAGIYLGMGIVCLWTAITIRTQGTLVYLLALGVFLGGIGRLVSMSIVGVPEPAGLWFGYLAPELIVPVIVAIAHSRKPAAATAAA